MRDLDTLNRELEAAGAWVFAGGCCRARPRWCGSRTARSSHRHAEARTLGGVSIVDPDLDAAL